MRTLYCYIILSSGRAHNIRLSDHPAARQQLRNLQHIVRDKQLDRVRYIYDYARRHSELADLPRLRDSLVALEASSASLLIDDLGRLFRTVPGEYRRDLLKELIDAGGHIFGFRQHNTLSNLQADKIHILLNGGLPGTYSLGGAHRNPRDESERQRQTMNATIASRIVRSNRADEVAAEIRDLRQELASASQEPTLRALAEASNERGLRTSRGKLHTTSSIHRALARAPKEKLLEKAPRRRNKQLGD